MQIVDLIPNHRNKKRTLPIAIRIQYQPQDTHLDFVGGIGIQRRHVEEKRKRTQSAPSSSKTKYIDIEGFTEILTQSDIEILKNRNSNSFLQTGGHD